MSAVAGPSLLPLVSMSLRCFSAASSGPEVGDQHFADSTRRPTVGGQRQAASCKRLLAAHRWPHTTPIDCLLLATSGRLRFAADYSPLPCPARPALPPPPPAAPSPHLPLRSLLLPLPPRLSN